MYLKQPIAVCGNAVCEDDGKPTSPETAESCPSDCHAGTWARNYDPSLSSRIRRRGRRSTIRSPTSRIIRLAALAPDGTMVVVGDTTPRRHTRCRFGGRQLSGLESW